MKNVLIYPSKYDLKCNVPVENGFKFTIELSMAICDGHTGYVAEPNSVAIASAITTFLAHPEPESFEHNLEVVRKQYAWSHMANAALGAGQKDE